MRRNIIRQGNNSHTLTIPIRWIKEHELGEGDAVDIEEEDDRLVISIPKESKKAQAGVTIDLKNYNYETSRGILNQTYRMGFDRIMLLTHSESQQKAVKLTTKETLLGFELTEEKADRMIVENIAEPSSDKFEVILRKLFLNIKHEGEDILESLKSGKKDMEKREEVKLNVDNFTNYIRRTVIKNKVGGTKASYNLFNMCSVLSLISHSYYYMYKHIQKNRIKNVDKEILKILAEVNRMFSESYESFYRKDIAMINRITGEKKDVQEEKIFMLMSKKKGAENVVLFYLAELVRLIQMSTNPQIGIHIQNSPN